MTQALDQRVHEEAFVHAFIQKSKQERCTALLSNPRRRRDFTQGLAHFKWLDERFCRIIPSKIAHTADQFVSLLRQKGVGPTVWVISEDSTIDARELELIEAMHKIWGGNMGTILSSVPGRLAYFCGEEAKSDRLLERS